MGPAAPTEARLGTPIAALCAAAAAIVFYAVDRTRASIANGPFDPDGITGAMRIEYFWRMMLAGFIASVVFYAVLHVSRRVGERGLRWAIVGATLSTAVASALSVLFP
jgi:uncharacterized BrkB/YihY/UPF0761 family membrane protein